MTVESFVTNLRQCGEEKEEQEHRQSMQRLRSDVDLLRSIDR